MNGFFKITSFVFILSTCNVFAAEPMLHVSVDESISRGPFYMAVGSKVSFHAEGEDFTHSGIFLGEVRQPDASVDSYMILNNKNNTVYYAKKSSVEMAGKNLQSILKVYEQKGGTCTGYAINDFLAQMNFSGFVGNKELAKKLSTEEGRTQQLVDAINQYYLVLQHKFSILGILKQYGKEYAFNCTQKIFSSAEEAQNYLISQLDTGFPVLLSFSVGPRMDDGKLKLVNYNDRSDTMDNRAWLPRRVGDRNMGGHSIVAAASFLFKGESFAVVLDSDWDQPRIWSLQQAIGTNTAMSDISFLSCK